MKRHVVALLAVLTCALSTSIAVVGSPTADAADGAERAGRAADRRVVSREIAIEVVNGTDALLSCLPKAADEREHVVRARMIGPRRVVDGRAGSQTFQVLVHDAGTGGWFWNLHGRGISRSVDYATQLARKGKTVVVLDRLGYDRSPLRSGATCLSAQAAMLGTVVDHLYAGLYEFTARPDAATPHASHVVLHGHGTGATIARLTAERYRNVQALVLMSPTTANPSALALQTLRGQAAACLRGARFAPYGATDQTYRRLLFRSAGPAVQRAATRLRNPTPCGDVASLVPTVLSTQSQAVRVPTLVLRGSADARSARDGITATSGVRLVRRSIAGAGSALPLERQAPAVRRAVLSFVGSLDDRSL